VHAKVPTVAAVHLRPERIPAFRVLYPGAKFRARSRELFAPSEHRLAHGLARPAESRGMLLCRPLRQAAENCDRF